MGCKFGQKDEEKNEIKKSTIDLMTESEGGHRNNEEHNLDYYIKREQEELNGIKEKPSAYENYSTEVLKIINDIRTKPQRYADNIEDSMESIYESGEGDTKKIVFKKQINVVLNRGEPAFREAAKKLRDMDPLPVFQLCDELRVPLPTSFSDLHNPNYLRNQINNMRQRTKVDAYFKEMVKSPTISALLMIVDDNKENSGKKRTLLLHKDLRKIGINSGFVDGTFVAYFAFSR